MRTKSVTDLCQLSDKDLFTEIAIGLELIYENSTQIYADARQLAELKSPRGHRILRGIAIEEAAKFFILLDAIRCSRNGNNNFSTQIVRFSDHLAKGIYAEYYESKLAKFCDIYELIDFHRKEYYLDGPNDVDWIFHNWILQQREESIYVDYIESDGEHIWLSPKRYDITLGNWYPNILKLMCALNDAGCTNKEALEIIATKWRSIKMTDDFTWIEIRNLNIETLLELGNRSLLREQPQEAYGVIADLWLFPLHSVDLKKVKIDQAELRETRDRWSPY